MARLLTSHDPYHIHAILGLLALCHYLWRIGSWHLRGIAFSDPTFADVLGVTESRVSQLHTRMKKRVRETLSLVSD